MGVAFFGFERISTSITSYHDIVAENDGARDIDRELAAYKILARYFVLTGYTADEVAARTAEVDLSKVIVTEVQLPEGIVCNSTLWAACIGGAAQQDNYRTHIEAAGLKVIKAEDNPAYQFISDNARGAAKKFGVKSVSLLAVKP